MSNAGNIFYNWPNNGIEKSLNINGSKALAQRVYDLVIVGAGIVGCALAYKLSRYQLKILLVDKNYDIGESTSKGSSAIIHTGFDAVVDSLEAKLVSQSSKDWPVLATLLKIPFEQCGALLLAANEEQHAQLAPIYDKAIRNGVTDVRLLTGAQAKTLEPNATNEILGGIHIPRESIIDPFSACIAFAEVALLNGVDVFLGAEVTAVENASAPLKSLITQVGEKITTRTIVNVAGLGSEKLSKQYGGEPFDTNPRRGQFLIFDKYSRSAINHILLPIPTSQTKGVLVIPTIFGNLIAGPTAEDFAPDHQSLADTEVGTLKKLLEGASRLYPDLKKQPVIGLFSGVRSNCSQGSYWIRCNDHHPGIITVAGIRSTGITSSPALADYIIDKIDKELGVELLPDNSAIDHRPENKWPGWWKPPFEDNERVRLNPDYAKMVCFCEQISHGEIIDHLDSPLKPRTLDGLKRRSRAQMGRCQGFDCMLKVAEIIATRCKLPLHQITKSGPGSELVISS